MDWIFIYIYIYIYACVYVRKTYLTPGENSSLENKKDLRQTAGEIMAYMKANNYDVVEAGEVSVCIVVK